MPVVSKSKASTSPAVHVAMAPSMAAGCDRTADAPMGGNPGRYPPDVDAATTVLSHVRPLPARGRAPGAGGRPGAARCTGHPRPAWPISHPARRGANRHNGDDQRPGDPGAAPRRHGHGACQSRNGGRVPRGRRPLRDDASGAPTPARCRPGRRRVRLRRRHIGGFSLTHLSGTGYPSYQDVPILPTVGAIGTAPDLSKWRSPGLPRLRRWKTCRPPQAQWKKAPLRRDRRPRQLP